MRRVAPRFQFSMAAPLALMVIGAALFSGLRWSLEWYAAEDRYDEMQVEALRHQTYVEPENACWTYRSDVDVVYFVEEAPGGHGQLDIDRYRRMVEDGWKPFCRPLTTEDGAVLSTDPETPHCGTPLVDAAAHRGNY